MKKLFVIICCYVLSGCSVINPQHPNPANGTNDKLASTAYNVAVGAKGFLDQLKSNHPECAETQSNNVSTLIQAAITTSQMDTTTRRCHLIVQATAAKDLLIDAGKEYCSGGDFETGGACNPPNKNDPKGKILADKLKGSLDFYTAVEKDLKGIQ